MSKSNSRLLGIVIVLELLILAGQWVGGVGYGNYAHAQLQTDPGRDRQAMLDEARATNAKLDKLIEILRSGEVQVRAVQSDETKGKATGR